MSSDDEDFVFYGTPIEREEEITTRKKKAVAEASGQLRTALAPWKQEVRDEEGRRRFHGAFTGGYSAGYYNTVGSKEGWAPQTFTSSRKNRAEHKEQSIYSFLDEDEKSELEGRSLGPSMQFDTFGFTGAELARKQAEKEQQQRPSIIPGPIPDELIVPATESIGVKLLLKMGWRQGRSIKDASRNSRYDVHREARKAFLAFSREEHAGSRLDEEDSRKAPDLPTDCDEQLFRSTPAFVLNPKQDLYGLGYDPFKQAPEFREKKRQRTSGRRDMQHNMSLSMKEKVGPGFGIGALEDMDAEDEDIYAPGYDLHDTYVQEIEEPSSVKADTLRILDSKKHDVLSGFKVASTSDGQFARFDPPKIPGDFDPNHKFPAPLGHNGNSSEVPPPEVPPPEDNSVKVCIEGVASLVARSGKLFEDLQREKNQGNPLFGFLSGGNGCDYYARKLWEERQKRTDQIKLWDAKTPTNSEKLTAERRGKILGEKSLERSTKDPGSMVASVDTVNIQLNLSETFTKPASISGHPDKPFSDDPVKQKRYEQFLKEKYEGGLRTKDSGGSSYMSELDRARERLEFEAVESTERGRSGKEKIAANDLLAELSGATGLQFTSGGVEINNSQQDKELIMKGMYPKREEFQWRPAPILCKRFDLIDPYMGKPPPAPRAKSKMDSLIFMPDAIKTVNVGKPLTSQTEKSVNVETTEKELENQVEAENVERPVDLYKAIFSDDSDDEEEHPNTVSNQVEDTQKKMEVANSTLNRLIAGDFLESLGKELGIMVPPDLPKSENRVVNVDTGSEEPRPAQKTRPNAAEYVNDVRIDGTRIADGEDGGKGRSIDVLEEKRNLGTDGAGRSSSPEYRRSKKHSSRRGKSRSLSSDSETPSDSDDHGDKYSRSRSRRKEKRSSREESGSRKHHSKHHKHRRKESPKRSHRSSGKDYDGRKNKKHKYEK